ncbi:MAG: phosphopantothenoylcysteine decarboxylase [Cyanobacteriota bacterium]|nr:phosphopantothenoylcysteine decarboxylase [Cyanobacteriota bacterium]
MSLEPWTFHPPASEPIGDHAVPRVSDHLLGRRIALVVCGSIAAYRTPDLARALRRRGAEVTAFCSPEALRYVGRQALEWATCRPLVTRLSWRAEHLADAEPFDAWLVAPATANTIAKLASGIADTVVTAALAAALGRLERGLTQLLVAPTLHGCLHTSVLEGQVRRLDQLGVRFIAPRDAYGKHNLPDSELIVAVVARVLARGPLRGQRILVTGGPTPVPIDRVRRLVNRFSGRLAIAVAEDLLLRGAHVELLLGDGAVAPPAWIPFSPVASYDAYRDQVLALAPQLAAAVCSAGVADYRPSQPVVGKIASGQPGLQLHLEPTPKVIDELRAQAPQLPIVAFKYEEETELEPLLALARARLDHYPLVVANRGVETHGHQQTAWLVSRTGERRVEGKPAIAAAIGDQLEQWLGEGELPATAR